MHYTEFDVGGEGEAEGEGEGEGANGATNFSCPFTATVAGNVPQRSLNASLRACETALGNNSLLTRSYYGMNRSAKD